MVKITELCLMLLTDCRLGFRLLHLRFDPILLSQDSPQPPSARHTQQLSFFYIFKNYFKLLFKVLTIETLLLNVDNVKS